MHGWLPPKALAEHLDRASKQIAALTVAISRTRTDEEKRSIRTRRSKLIFEQMHLEEHIFAEAQRVINENRVVGEDGAAAGDQTVTQSNK